MKKSETTKCMMLIFNYYNKELEKDKTDMIINIWYECLKDLEYSYVKLAIYELIKISKYIPTIADIREKAQCIEGEENKQEYKAVDLTDLSQEDYARLMRKETTIEKLIEEGKVHV